MATMVALQGSSRVRVHSSEAWLTAFEAREVL